ncbi:unnamed protein product [Closterium sp. Naga37s-1]|nr:unnamed protein product [Closterium sp. Naga37s-1]
MGKSQNKLQVVQAFQSLRRLRCHRTSSKMIDFIDDDSDDELDLDITCDLLTRIRYTAILLVTFFLQPELGSVILTVRTLLKKVWSSALSPGAADGAKIQTLQPAFVARTKYCRLQLSLLREDDIDTVRQKVVDYQRSGNSKKIPLTWLFTEDADFLKEKLANPHAIEVVFKYITANISPDILKECLAVYKLKVKQRSLSAHLAASHTAALGSCHCFFLHRLQPRGMDLHSDRLREGKGEVFMTAADHVAAANHLIQLEKIGTATRVTMDKAVLAPLKKDYGM